MSKFKSVQHAAEVFLNSTNRSQEQFEAFNYIILNAPPDFLHVLQEGMRRCFPDLKPTHCDDNGIVYYEASAIAEKFGMTVDEICKDLPEECMVRASKGQLNRIQ